AVIGAYRNFELNQLDILKRPGRAFYVEEEGVPGYDELIVIAHRDKLADPKYVRMGWRNIATPNLQDKSGIPAFPFASKKID
ncbi:MAG: ABC transporter substrate-binding protein, partial [Phycisphaerae bacterium]|nr:ABC transporter substrate-binding protein [Phycisphaerae bacterium]